MDVEGNMQEKMSSKEKMKKGLYNSKMDPVGQADKDIDNDGDVDKSDKYLHNRRKAISKNIKKNKGETAIMNPKMNTAKGSKDGEMEAKESKDLDTANATKAIKHDCASHVEHAEWGAGQCISGQHTIVETSDGEGYVTHYDVMFEHGIEKDVPVAEMKVIKSSSHGHMRKKKPAEQKESRIRQALKAVLEAENHSPNKDKSEKPEDALKGGGAKQMAADMKGPTVDIETQSHDDAAKAGRAGPGRKMRSNDNKAGDSKVINQPVDATKSAKGDAMVKSESYDNLSPLKSAYESMQPHVITLEDLDESMLGHSDAEKLNGGKSKDSNFKSAASHIDYHHRRSDGHQKSGGDQDRHRYQVAKKLGYDV